MVGEGELQRGQELLTLYLHLRRLKGDGRHSNSWSFLKYRYFVNKIIWTNAGLTKCSHSYKKKENGIDEDQNML